MQAPSSLYDNWEKKSTTKNWRSRLQSFRSLYLKNGCSCGEFWGGKAVPPSMRRWRGHVVVMLRGGKTLGPRITTIRTGHLKTYLLSPWCRVLLEKLTGLQLVKKFPAFHGTRRFITALTSVRHLSLSWASPIQSIYPHPTSWRSVPLLSTHLRLGLPSGLFRLQSRILQWSDAIFSRWTRTFTFDRKTIM